MRKSAVIISLIIYFLAPALGHSSGQPVHEIINGYASLESTLDKMLKQAGYENGLQTIFNFRGRPMSGKELVKKGGRDADTPLSDTRKHFFNPNRPWDKAGLLGFQANILWAQSKDNWNSWQEAREAQYLGALGDDSQMGEALYKLGHVAHHVVDQIVPAHASDDAHAFYDAYEHFTVILYNFLNYKGQNSGHLEISGPSSGIFDNFILHPAAPVPITALWDIDPSGLVGPFDTQSGGANWAYQNFISDDSWDKPNFDWKNGSDLFQVDINKPDVIEDGIPYYYVWKLYQGTKLYPLGRISRWGWYMTKLGMVPPIEQDRYVVSKIEKLITRNQVLHAARLFDYFSRGVLGVKVSRTKKQVEITNESGEDMNGNLRILVNPGRAEIANVDGFSLSAGSSRIIEDITIKSDETGKVVAVFKGRLGNEDDSVAVGSKTLYPVQYYLGFYLSSPVGNLIWNLTEDKQVDALPAGATQVETKPFWVSVEGASVEAVTTLDGDEYPTGNSDLDDYCNRGTYFWSEVHNSRPANVWGAYQGMSYDKKSESQTLTYLGMSNMKWGKNLEKEYSSGYPYASGEFHGYGLERGSHNLTAGGHNASIIFSYDKTVQNNGQIEYCQQGVSSYGVPYIHWGRYVNLEHSSGTESISCPLGELLETSYSNTVAWTYLNEDRRPETEFRNGSKIVAFMLEYNHGTTKGLEKKITYHIYLGTSVKYETENELVTIDKEGEFRGIWENGSNDRRVETNVLSGVYVGDDFRVPGVNIGLSQAMNRAVKDDRSSDMRVGIYYVEEPEE